MNQQVFYQAIAPFEAARKLSMLPSDHPASRLHGHSFKAKLRTSLPGDWASFQGAEIDDLQMLLEKTTKPFDYAYLNDVMTIPTDENLARWIRENINLSVESIGVQSTQNQGVDIDHEGHAHLWYRFQFEAAHCLPNVPEGHQCGRMHGHSFEVILHAQQPRNDSDIGVDYDWLAKTWQPIQDQLNHSCLNDIEGLENPTSEMIAKWIWGNLYNRIPCLSWVSVYETRTGGCHYDGSDFRIWKQQRFEAATMLGHAPTSDPRQRLHGHSYIARLHLTSPLDQVMGWTVDYGDVKSVFTPIYKQLDHHDLSQIDGTANSDALTIANWVRNRLSNVMPQLDRFDLYQKPGCGCILNWGAMAPALPV
ncbi:MAG: 6-pyruvoyl tetrahydropterin synthase [Gammaproteobacteria bacterium]|nr:6-pyruvoyl tetrahydropterin synthase [Gammaproteobacteria bacterium]